MQLTLARSAFHDHDLAMPVGKLTPRPPGSSMSLRMKDILNAHGRMRRRNAFRYQERQQPRSVTIARTRVVEVAEKCMGEVHEGEHAAVCVGNERVEY
jgi:hypothetical protein